MRCDAAEASTSKTSVKKPTATQTKLADAFANSTPYDSQRKRWKELTEAVAQRGISVFIFFLNLLKLFIFISLLSMLTILLFLFVHSCTKKYFRF